MMCLDLLYPANYTKVIWPATACSTRIAARLIPIRIVRCLLHSISEYAAAPNPASPYDTLLDEEVRLLRNLRNARTVQQYQVTAERLDEIQNNDAWKQDQEACESGYNPEVIRDHMQKLAYARSTSDLSAMQHLIRTNLSRDLGNMNVLSLYKNSWSGTKCLTEEYIATVLDAINKFAEASAEFKLARDEIQFYQESLEDSLRYFGRSALTLSGGAILGMKHIGVVKTLWEANLLPEIISGASAGSIVAAVIGVSSDAEMQRTLESFAVSDLDCFDPAGTGTLGWLYQRLATAWHNGAFFTMTSMERVLKKWLGEMTFREAHYKTQRVLNICVSSADSGEPRLLNYITAPNVLIWSAVCASCSVPMVFPSANIYEKNPITKKVKPWMHHAKVFFVDGSMDHDIPMQKLAEMFNVNFFIVSQVNPHVRPFLDPEQDFGRQSVKSVASTPPLQSVISLVRSFKHAFRREVLQRAEQAREFGGSHDYLRWASLLSQQYTGDINILPEVRRPEYTCMMANPTPDFMKQAMVDGERATWPRLYRLKNCVAIELALIKAIYALRERVNFGPEARAARIGNSSRGRYRPYGLKSQHPAALRRRSLSNEHHIAARVSPANAPSLSAPSLAMRRNLSLGTLMDNLMMSTLSGSEEESPEDISEPEGPALTVMSNPELDENMHMKSYFPESALPTGKEIVVVGVDFLADEELTGDLTPC